VSGENLLLVLDDRLLIAQNPGLVSKQQQQPPLILQDPRLISDDDPIVGNNRLLIPDSRLCHW
jgi:hypothetical protein